VILLLALTLLHGTVHIGPTSPVCRTDTPCDRPAPRVVLTFTRGAQHVRTTTDTAGRYRVRLAPGTWTVLVRAGIHPRPVTLVVPRTASATRNFTVDSGIR
jgi:hypothetical protein